MKSRRKTAYEIFAGAYERARGNCCGIPEAKRIAANAVASAVRKQEVRRASLLQRALEEILRGTRRHGDFGENDAANSAAHKALWKYTWEGKDK